MAYIEWKEELSVGISEMDEQHKKWVSIINDLHSAMKNGKANAVMSDILKALSDYIILHFSDEEKLLKDKNCPDYFSHKKIHDRYAIKVKEMIADYMSGKVLMSIEVMESLKDWLTNHILIQDKKYGAYLKDK
jgi:hemerythrin